MQTKKEQIEGVANAEAAETADASQEEATLQWLLELDRDDPEENIFVVDRRGGFDLSLSAQEAAVAARPMMRGRADADDLSTYVDEEIVMGEPGSTNADDDGVDGADEDMSFDGLMAVDFSRQSAEDEGLLTNVVDGSDILGLEDDDDMGEQYLVVKRVKKQERAGETQDAAAEAPAQPQAETAQSQAETAQPQAEPTQPQAPADEPPQDLVAAASAEAPAELPLVEDEPADHAGEELELTLPIVDESDGLAASADLDIDLSAAELPGEAGALDIDFGDLDDELVDLTAGEFEGADLETQAAAIEIEVTPVAGVADVDDIELELPELDMADFSAGMDLPELDLTASAQEAAPEIDKVDDAIAAAADDELPELDLTQSLEDEELPELDMAASAEETPADDEPATLPGMEAVAEVTDLGSILDLEESAEELPEAPLEDLFIASADEDDEGVEFVEEVDLGEVLTGAMDVQDEPDLHEDFAELTRGGELLTQVTPRIAPLMEEVDMALAARLNALGWPAGCVTTEVSIAADPAAVHEALAAGFEPVAAICSETPDALAGLDAEHIGVIYLRLYRAGTGENCNQLFVEEPASDAPETPARPSAADRGLRLVENKVFEEDLLDEDLNAPLEAPEWLPDGDELEAMFSDMDGDDPDRALDELPAAAEIEELLGADAEDTDMADFLAAEAADLPSTVPGDEAAALDGALTELPAEDACIAAQPEPETASEPEPAPEAELAAELHSAAEQDVPELVPEALPEAVPEGNALAEDLSWCIPEGIEFSHCSPTGGEIFAEFLDAFIEEGSSELEKLEDAISEWEADCANGEHQAVVGRVLHTIKGIAKGVGLHYYGTLIHNFETLLERMPKPAAGEEAAYFRIVNAWLDAAVRGVDFVQAERRDIPCELPYREEAVEPAAEAVAEAPAPMAEPEPAPLAPAAQTPAVADIVADARERNAEELRRKQEDKKLADEGARVLAAQQSVRITSEKLDLLLNLANQAQQLGVRTSATTSRTKRATAELQGRLTSMRAHISDIADGALFNPTAKAGSGASDMDALEMDRYSDLQEAANILREGVEDLADLIELVSRHNGQAEALLQQQSTVISSIGSSIRAARVVPVSRLTPGLRRLVRTVSSDLGKEVAFRVTNEVGTLDRDDYARCQTILEHMVRNALDHGIESAEERRAAGKPSVGQITLDVHMSGADSVIVLSDDGRGMDPAKIRESARNKGIDVDVYALSDEEALKLIFHKGFSTAAEVSQISGRGVGMDIVASELQKMGGDVRIVSEVGKGTAFHLRIPSNVAVNGALLVSAGESSYAIPLGGLVAVDEVPVDTFFDAVESGARLTLAGLECEPAYLGTLCQSGNLPDRAAWRKTIPLIVAGSDARHMAIAVDDVEEALELVIRSLGAQFAAVPGVAGGATTADGEAVVALDLNVLVSCFGEGQGTAIAVGQPREEKLLALVVDDSRTQRMVATSQLESVGLETATAENGAVAIDWLNTTERLPDIILMDVEMPVKDGIQALREIRKSARFNDIPVIMITSRTGIKHRSLAEEAGCNGYMGKPFNFRMLIGQINELTGHRLDLEQQDQV
ncbi:response regulator [Mangrovimicrobium sediminis]|uniref:Chemotaxis protein CheA n=1 Tax=Mangrovimicrobium sediminis TaxID=2562682 RepID=A0A4Z0M3I7_9GAMM|nr:response regulator [Haliea sp. SAOS-164]TGD74010.1 response regulator [Haliea sp. SAOS-164]